MHQVGREAQCVASLQRIEVDLELLFLRKELDGARDDPVLLQHGQRIGRRLLQMESECGDAQHVQ